MGLSDKRRKELRERVMDDVQDNMFNYHDFVMGCVKVAVNGWSDADLLDWVGEKE